MRPTLTLLALLASSHGLGGGLAAQDRCQEANRKFDATLRAYHEAWAGGRDVNQLIELRDLRLNAGVKSFLTGGRLQPQLASNLAAHPAVSPDEMRTFADRGHLPAEIRALIAAGQFHEFWARASDHFTRRLAKEWAVVDPAQQQRLDAAAKAFYAAAAERHAIGCNSAAGQASTEGPPRTADEGPLPVRRYQAGPNPDFSNAPFVTSDLITRWIQAYHAYRAGSPSHWRAGRMTQQDYLDVGNRIEIWRTTMGGCTRGTVNGEFTTTCRTAPIATGLRKFFNFEEIAAFEARQDDLANAFQGLFHLIKM